MAETAAPTKQVGAASITALVLAIAALLLVAWATMFHPVALILSVAAVLVAAVSLINGRKERTIGTWVAVAGVALGAAGIAVVVFANFV